LTGRTDEKTTCAAVSHCHSQGSLILLVNPQDAPGCIIGAHMKQQQGIIVAFIRLGSLLMMPLIPAPGKEHTSPESVPGRQTGASVPLRRESPTTITHCLFLVVLAVIQGAIRLPYSAPASLLL